jgi:hypothetical protein
MLKPNYRRVFCELFFLGAMLLLSGHFTTISAKDKDMLEPKESSFMNLAFNTTAALSTIPTIDAAAPAVFETASFGLG